MQRKILLMIISIFILLIIIIATMLINFNYKKQTEVCFKNHCFKIELAVSPEERSKGLMLREKLDQDKGMLFVFEKEEECPFWMKDTLIPLDIIWINENNEVVFITSNAQPCKDLFCPVIKPDKKAKYVLEINGGIAENIGLTEGERMIWK